MVEHAQNSAFCIKDVLHSYQQLAKQVECIRACLQDVDDTYIGLVANDDLTTYASIIAVWMEGKCYVPFHPHQPLARCKDIIEQVKIQTILDSSEVSRFPSQRVIFTSQLEAASTSMAPLNFFNEERPAYILFTSGSTGQPKGVPITFGNLSAFLDAFHSLGIELKEDDRCLQMFDLTFDLSVGSFLPPLLYGACVYTTAEDSIKWQEVLRLLEEHRLTVTLMVPSVIHYMRPYLDEIEAPQLRYSLFCGEALMVDDTAAWREVVPHSRIWNVYGPIENTIYCTNYEIEEKICQYNGIVCIGKEMLHTKTAIVNQTQQVVASEEVGELCLAGRQLTPGYWGNAYKTAESFFEKDGIRWYLTGDICKYDQNRNIIYLGRKDSQVKIQGYRIELSEIENVARRFYNHEVNVITIALGSIGHQKLALAIEKEDDGHEHKLLDYLKEYLPAYMIPEKVVYMKTFPQNTNNKIDRNAMKESIR